MLNIAAHQDKLIARRREALALAVRCEFDATYLYQQYQRRSFGSFTTTLDGSPEQRDLYCAAWEIAVVWQRKHAQPAVVSS